MLKKYLTYINENKSSDTLYHLVDIQKIFYILKNNILKSYYFSNISTTRDKMLNGYVGDSPTTLFKLELDGKKLSQKYKIKPFSYKSKTNIYFDESEEQIQTNKISDVFKYVNKIILIKKRVEALKNSGWFNTDGGVVRGRIERYSLPKILKEIVTLINKKGFDLYVQEGSVIKKDSEYINSILNYPIEKIHHGYIYYTKEEKEEPVYSKNLNKNLNVVKTIYHPIDVKNETIKGDVVVGYKYNNLWLIKDRIQPENDILFEFDYVYQPENIIKQDEEYFLVKQAKLNMIDAKIPKNKNISV